MLKRKKDDEHKEHDSASKKICFGFNFSQKMP